MTYRKSLMVGLLVGLSAAPAAIQATDNLGWQTPASTIGTFPEITLQPSASASSVAQTSWQRSEDTAPADIRFKKPDVPGSVTATTGTASAAQTSESSAQLLLAPAAPISTSKPPVRIEINDTGQPISGAATKQGAPLSALFTPAVQQQAANRPAPNNTPATSASQTVSVSTQVANATQPSTLPLLEEISPATRLPQSTPQPIVQTADRSDVRLTDEQLQLVARILSDNQVLPTAQEEPLPSAREADPLRNGSNNRHNGHGPDFDNGEMYYGECCPPAPPLFWVAGVEATFLSPDINSDGASWAVEDVLEDREEVHVSEDVDSIYLSPRIWIGVQGCAWGANLRYWHLNASESHFDPSIGQAGTWDDFDCGKPNVGFFSMSRLEAYTIDLEITRRFCLHDCWMQGSFGVRHADIQYAESITGTAFASDANLFGYAESDRYTRGTGLVFGLYGRKPLFPCSCVNWYYNLRWSALWGPTRTAVETGATVLAVGANAGSVNGAYTCVDDNLFIGEIQLGLEWNYALQCVPANAFFRAGIEYQRWTGGMGYSEAGSFAGVEVNNTFEQIGSAFASAAAPELDLIGITIGTGLTW